jgi:hypothetical protein
MAQKLDIAFWSYDRTRFLPFDIASIKQSFFEGGYLQQILVVKAAVQMPDHGHLTLRFRPDRPDRHSPNKREKFTPSHCLPQYAGLRLTTLRLQQGFWTGETTLAVSLHGTNPEPLMSALGQKQTLRHVRVMSALPPKADIRCRDRHVPFVPKADIEPKSLIQVDYVPAPGMKQRIWVLP